MMHFAKAASPVTVAEEQRLLIGFCSVKRCASLCASFPVCTHFRVEPGSARASEPGRGCWCALLREDPLGTTLGDLFRKI